MSPGELDATWGALDWKGVLSRAEGDGWVGRVISLRTNPAFVGPKLWRFLQHECAGDGDSFNRRATFDDLGRYSCSCLEENSCRCGGRLWIYDDTRFSESGECSRSCDPIFARWVYVVAPSTLTVLATVCFVSSPGYGEAPHFYRHVALGSARLKAPEPHWLALEELTRRLKRQPGACPEQRLW